MSSTSSEEEEVDHRKLKKPEEQLLAAAVNGDEEFIKKLLDENSPSLLNYKDNDGYTVLHRACYSSKPSILKLCLDYIQEPDNLKDLINSVTNDGWTPLHSACRWNSYQCVEILLEKGANVNLQSSGGNTPLHLAADANNARESLTLLLLHPEINATIVNEAGETALELANRRGKLGYLFELARESINKF